MRLTISLPLLVLILVTAWIPEVHLETTVLPEELEENVVSETIIETENGPVQGIIQKSRDPTKEYVSFLGLRYSEKPERFEAPKKLEEKWTEPNIASEPGSECVQIDFATGVVEGKEDCNFLNIHIPKAHLENGVDKLPVMVWIHGGGFAFGDGYNYTASYFMENEDVILVTINYRLGAFGFLSTEDEVILGNNGLRDMTMALEWVQKNIGKFKGSSESVTIFGESAGSAAVNYLVMSPLTKGLFHKAIMQSGVFSFWSYDPYPRENSIKLAKYLNCSLPIENKLEESVAIKECLKNLPTDELAEAQGKFNVRWPATNPISRFLPTAVETVSPFFSGKPRSFFTGEDDGSIEYANQVPVIIGANKDEGSLLFAGFIRALKKLPELDEKWEEVAPKAFAYEDLFPKDNLPKVSKLVRQQYFGNESISEETLPKLEELFSDVLFHLPAISAAARMAKQGCTVYPYEFSYLGENNIAEIFGLPFRAGTVAHGDDIMYFFTNPTMTKKIKLNSEDEKFSKNMIKMWTHFAKNGKPNDEWNGSKLPWKPLKLTSEDNLKFDVMEFKKQPEVKMVDLEEKLKFWIGLQQKFGLAGKK